MKKSNTKATKPNAGKPKIIRTKSSSNARPGNKNALGNKGGGRKSAYVEAMRARMLVDGWFDGGVDIDSIKKELQAARAGKGKVKLFHHYLARALESDMVLVDQARKLFADRQRIDDGGGQAALDKRTRQLSDKLKKQAYET